VWLNKPNDSWLRGRGAEWSSNQYSPNKTKITRIKFFIIKLSSLKAEIANQAEAKG
jgi:hypothetical protein